MRAVFAAAAFVALAIAPIAVVLIASALDHRKHRHWMKEQARRHDELLAQVRKRGEP